MWHQFILCALLLNELSHAVSWWNVPWSDIFYHDVFWCDVFWRGVFWRDVFWRDVVYQEFLDMCWFLWRDVFEETLLMWYTLQYDFARPSFRDVLHVTYLMRCDLRDVLDEIFLNWHACCVETDMTCFPKHCWRDQRDVLDFLQLMCIHWHDKHDRVVLDGTNFMNISTKRTWCYEYEVLEMMCLRCRVEHG
jgi:hypothetical protein